MYISGGTCEGFSPFLASAAAVATLVGRPRRMSARVTTETRYETQDVNFPDAAHGRGGLASRYRRPQTDALPNG